MADRRAGYTLPHLSPLRAEVASLDALDAPVPGEVPRGGFRH